MTQLQVSQQISKIIDSIREASNFSDVEKIAHKIISMNKLHQIELVKRLEVHLIDTEGLIPMELKINIFQTMTALLLTEQRQRFLKHFVTRILYFLKKCSVTISDSKEKSQRVMQIFKKWETANIFCQSFYTKLRDIANSIFYFNTEQKAPIFKKYTKLFLIEYRDTWKVEITKILYDSHQIKVSGLEQCKNLKSQFNDLRKTSQNLQQMKSKAADLKLKVEQTIEKLMMSLKLNEKGAGHLGQLLQKQRQGLYSDTKEEYINGHA